MGDISTHALINQYVAKQLLAVVKTTSIPEADYTYVELGNFLTDVSQFRDPPAYRHAREPARQLAQEAAGGFSGPVGVNAWADGMFGVSTGGARHGWLAQFLQLMAFGLTHQIFDDDGLARLGPVLDAMGRRRSPLMPKHPLTGAEVDRVLADNFTQYYPHEHVDFPPLREGSEPRHREETMFKRADSGLITYLESDLLFLSEELSKLEEAWMRAKAQGLTEQQRRDFLIRLGHLLHAVEDYFFHSNFAEIRQWRFLLRFLIKKRKVDLTTPAGLAQLLKNMLRDTLHDPTSVHLRRMMWRRLRYPVYTTRGLSTEESADGSELIFTGGFGQSEVWHTLGSALEAIEAWVDRHVQQVPGGDPRNTDLVLMRMLFSADARRDMVRGDDKLMAQLRETHATQVMSDRYPNEIAQRHHLGALSADAAARLTEAFALDRAREEEYKYLPGPGGVLLSMLRTMQEARDESARQTRMFDATAASITIPRSANDATGENVGTHSLLSKDSEDKDPFRADALALASYASAGVATALLRRIEANTPINQGVDWDAVLHFYVRYPKHPSWNWEEELIATVHRDKSTFKQPNLGKLKDKENSKLLGPKGGADKLAQRRTGVARAQLEAFYASFESSAPP